MPSGPNRVIAASITSHPQQPSQQQPMQPSLLLAAGGAAAGAPPPTAPPLPAPPARCLDGGAARPPPGDVELTAVPEFDAVARAGARQLLAAAHIAAPAAAADDAAAERPPVSVSAVIDRSGSMGGAKLELVKRTLLFVVRELRAGDRLGVVAYDHEVAESLPLTAMTPDGKARARDAVSRLVPGGCTNLSGGLFAGLDQVQGRRVDPAAYADPRGGGRAAPRRGLGLMFQRQQQQQFHSVGQLAQPPPAPPTAPPAPVEGIPVAACDVEPAKEAAPLPPAKEAAAAPGGGGVSSVWLFTDGMANAGVTDTAGIVAGAAARGAGGGGPSVFTFGFGEQHNDVMLRAVAEQGAGMYYFIEDPESIPRAFAECLGGLLSVVAQGLAVTVTAAAGVRILRVLGHDGARVDTAARTAEVRLTDLYAEEERDVVVELAVAPDAAELLLTAELTYAEAPGGRARRAVAEARVARPDAPPDAPQATHALLDRQRNRLLAAEALREARREAAEGRMGSAQSALQRAQDGIKRSSTAAEDYCQDLLDDIRECHDTAASQSVWHARGAKLCQQTEMCHARQRSSGMKVGKGGRSRYANATQMRMQAASAVDSD